MPATEIGGSKRSNELKIDMRDDLYSSSQENLQKLQNDSILKRIPMGAEATTVLVSWITFTIYIFNFEWINTISCCTGGCSGIPATTNHSICAACRGCTYAHFDRGSRSGTFHVHTHGPSNPRLGLSWSGSIHCYANGKRTIPRNRIQGRRS